MGHQDSPPRSIGGHALDPAGEAILIACADLAGRTGAKAFEIGYLHDGVPVEKAGWYAHAQFRGARILIEQQPGPVDAAYALAVRLLTGAKCVQCGSLVTLASDGTAFAFTRAHLADGTTWNAEEAAAAGQCRWRLVGQRWEPSCPEPPGSAFDRRTSAVQR
jgi:hypothetical protein